MIHFSAFKTATKRHKNLSRESGRRTQYFPLSAPAGRGEGWGEVWARSYLSAFCAFWQQFIRLRSLGSLRPLCLFVAKQFEF